MFRKKMLTVRELRKNPTKSEDILWQALRNRKFMNIKFRRQFPIAGFIVDFYCHKLKLVIEIEGQIHLNRDNKEYDEKRRNILKMYNISLIRIPSKLIEDNLSDVLNRITTILNSHPRLALARRGRGEVK